MDEGNKEPAVAAKEAIEGFELSQHSDQKKGTEKEAGVSVGTSHVPEEKKKGVIDDLLRSRSISFLSEVPLSITAELSRTRINMRDLLNYKSGSIIPLEKLAGEPMDVLVNGEYMAKGEVVVVNDKYAVRLTDLIEKMEILNRSYNEDLG